MRVQRARRSARVLQHHRRQGADALRRQQPAGVLQAQPVHRQRSRLAGAFGVILVGMPGRDRIDQIDQRREPDLAGEPHPGLPEGDMVPRVRYADLCHPGGGGELEKQPVHRRRVVLERVDPAGDEPERGRGDAFGNLADELERVFLQLADALLEQGAGDELDRFEPGPVEARGDRQHHAGGHGRRPQALMAVANGGVDETDFGHVFLPLNYASAGCAASTGCGIRAPRRGPAAIRA